jgi:CRP/FNR family cyclic AMP-dependent transcriptional regulator
MSADPALELLKQVPLFAQLSRKELHLLVREADRMAYPSGFVVIQEGQSGNEFWLVVSGSLTVRRGGQVVAELGPGDWFGELAVIDPAPRDATVLTTSEVDLLVLGRQRFWAVLEGSTTMMRKVIIGLAHRLRQMDEADTARRSAAAGQDVIVPGHGS